MKNYLKISAILCLALVTNNAFASNLNDNITSKCCKTLDVVPCGIRLIDHFTNQEGEYVQNETHTFNNNFCYLNNFTKQSRNSELLNKQPSNFFGTNVSFVNGILEFTRSTVKSQYGTLIINNKYKIKEDNKENFLKCVLLNGTTLFMDTNSVLEMGSGSLINITQNSKLLISGRTRIEPNCVINVGAKCCPKTGYKGTGGYLIVNALYPIDISNLTINLNNADSHLEIHGNDVRLSGLTINRFNKQATIHMQCIPLVSEFMPVKELYCDEEDKEPESESNTGDVEPQPGDPNNNGVEGDNQDPNHGVGDDNAGDGDQNPPSEDGKSCPCGCGCNKDKAPGERKPHHHSKAHGHHSSRKSGKKLPKSECHFPKNTVHYLTGKDECPNKGTLRARSKYKVDVDVNIKKYHPCENNNIRKYCSNKIDEE